MSAAHLKKLKQTAIQWFLRMQHADVEDSERNKFENWLMENRAHQEAYSEVSKLWDRFDSPLALEKLAVAMDQKNFFDQRERAQRFKKTIAGVLGAVAIGMAGMFSYQYWQSQPVMQLATQAPFGAVESKQLEDGTLMTMNSDTDIEVTYYRDRRLVKLKRGEAIFEVARDESRPFIVDSGYARVSVLGTRFAVNRMQKLIRISVDHGLVKVEKQNEQGETTAPLVLHKGQVAEVRVDKPSPLKSDRQAADAFSFEKGVITFDKADIHEIAETLSRYRQIPVVAQAEASNNHQITAVIKSQSIETFLRRLPDMAPVQVKTTQEHTLITAATAKK